MATYTVTFDVQGHGTAPSPQVVSDFTPHEGLYPSEGLHPSQGARAVEPTAPTAEGYNFGGWYRDRACTIQWNFSIYLTENITLYAKWTSTAVNLTGNRHKEKFTYKRVAFSNWQEHEEYDFITGGSIEYSSDATIKATGSFDIEGYDLPDVNDLIRVYYSFTDDNGEIGTYPLATLFVSFSSLNYVDTLGGVKATGSLEGSSVLKVLDDKKIGVPMSFSAGTNPVYEAQKLIESVGLNVNASSSSYSLASAITFDSGNSYLDIVNSLLSSAGFAEAYPDEYGTVLLRTSIDVKSGSAVFSFANDDNSIMYPQIEQSNDWQSTPNVVRLLYNDDSDCIAAWAINKSGSRTSLDARGGREITDFQSVSDLGESDYTSALIQKAREILIDESADVEIVSIEHAYVPISLNECVAVDYSGMKWTGNATNIAVELIPSIKTQLKVKRTSAQNINIETGYTTYREAE